MQYNLDELREKVRKFQKNERYEHTLGVMYTAASLTMRYGANQQDALLAGLLHDCAKGFQPEEQKVLCKSYGISLTKEELACPQLIHAKLGAYLAEHDYKISNTEVLDAIRWHTTGRPDMTLLEKIIYIADYIEPNRDKAPNLNHIRRLAFENLDQCVFEVLQGTLRYLREQGGTIDKMTEETFLFYKQALDV